MKRNKFLCAILLLACTACIADDKIVPYDQVPALARQMLEKFFSQTEVSFVMYDANLFDADYEIHYQDGTKAVSNRKGQIILVDCNLNPVPEAFIPQPILAYMRQHFPKNMVVAYDLDRNSYEVELDSHISLKFDKSFQLMEVDD